LTKEAAKMVPKCLPRANFKAKQNAEHSFSGL
jgi:hypothetical protein